MIYIVQDMDTHTTVDIKMVNWSYGKYCMLNLLETTRKTKKKDARHKKMHKHFSYSQFMRRSQSLAWPSANAAKTRGTSPNLEPL